jgi:Calcineurin-like phosphoesterase
MIAAGDLSFEYLGALIDLVNRPGVFVPGNHDPDVSGFSKHAGLSLRAGTPKDWPELAGFVNADGRVVDVGGVRVAGLGGCLFYRPGRNQWSELEQARRGRRIVRAARRLRRRDGRGVDVLLTHAPPRHCGDGEDQPHHGFECLHEVGRRAAAAFAGAWPHPPVRPARAGSPAGRDRGSQRRRPPRARGRESGDLGVDVLHPKLMGQSDTMMSIDDEVHAVHLIGGNCWRQMILATTDS